MKYGLSKNFKHCRRYCKVRKPICTIALSLLLFTTDAAYAKPQACTSNCVRVDFEIEAKNPEGGGTEILIMRKGDDGKDEELVSLVCPTFHAGNVCIKKRPMMFSQGEEIIIVSARMWNFDSWNPADWVRKPIARREIKADVGTSPITDQDGLKVKVTVARI